VVVIVILGILAATALPRFFDLTTDARKSVVAGVTGAFSTGVSMSHAKWLVDGSNIGTCTPDAAATSTSAATFKGCGDGATAIIEGQTTAFNAFGYPTDGIAAAELVPLTGLMTTTATSCMNVWNSILSTGRPTISIDPTNATATAVDWGAATAVSGKNSSTAVDSCTYTYFGGAKAATARFFIYNPADGAVALTNN
jgi:MSHA pilin protein MshB